MFHSLAAGLFTLLILGQQVEGLEPANDPIRNQTLAQRPFDSGAVVDQGLAQWDLNDRVWRYLNQPSKTNWRSVILTWLKPRSPQHQIPQLRANLTQPLVHVGRQACNLTNTPKFLVVAGGPVPGANEIALEKNVLYFQRTLIHMGFNPAQATVLFANGNDGQATIRYLDPQGQQQFKAPEIPYLQGPSTYANFQRNLLQVGQQSPDRPLFFYFTGHGEIDLQDPNNNTILLWQDQQMTVRQFTSMLDQLPPETPVIVMMAQCYSGSFANLIYQGGDVDQPLAPQSRCGFFATVKTRPSVGCTPAVNESDYRDYSSSFFAGLSGRSRVGQAVASADYDQNGRVSYAEAHAFAKVDAYTTDLPISTSESWLQERFHETDLEQVFRQPIVQVMAIARPEQRYVVQQLASRTGINPNQSFEAARQIPWEEMSAEQQTYILRLGIELIHIDMERRLRASGNSGAIATLDRLLQCEAGSWK